MISETRPWPASKAHPHLARPLWIAFQTINNDRVCEGALGLQVREILPLACRNESPYQANTTMRGCRQSMIDGSRVEEFMQGLCLGIVATIAAAGKPGVLIVLPSHRFCLPSGVDTGQAVRVAVAAETMRDTITKPAPPPPSANSTSS